MSSDSSAALVEAKSLEDALTQVKEDVQEKELVGNPMAASVADATPVVVAKPGGEAAVALKKPNFDRDTSYLDGIRGIAMIMVFNTHFAFATWQNTHPLVMQSGTPVDILKSEIGLILFFMLSGRLNVTSYFRRMASGTPINWISLPDSIFRRTLRLVWLPILAFVLQTAECASGGFLGDMAAQKILNTDGGLGYPHWCAVNKDAQSKGGLHVFTTPGMIVKGIVRLFTSWDHDTQLSTTSMLWSLPTQLWGMLYVMMLMPILAHMTPVRRFCLYTLLIVPMGYTRSAYLPFLMGTISADLKATGLIRKLQDKSRFAYITSEVLMVAVFLIFLCYNKIQYTILYAIDPITFWQGAIGSKNTSSNNFGTNPVVIFRAFLLLLWIEMSPAIQWLVGNFFFKWLGRNAFGFYVSQMSIIYLIIPPVITYYYNRGELYWKGVVNCWLAAFALNCTFGLILTRCVDKPMAKLAPWLLKTSRERGTLGVVIAAGHNGYSAIVKGIPHLLTKGIPGYITAKVTSVRSLGGKIRHWHSPAPIVPPPTHPLDHGLEQSQLHSTLFDADISDDEQAVRTRRLLLFWSWMAPLNFALIPGFGLIWGFLNPWHNYVTTDAASFSSLWRFLWLLALPYCLITLIGYGTPDITRTPEDMKKKKPVEREWLHHLYVVSVTRGSNEEATRRAHAKLKKLEKYHPAVRVMVLTDEPYAYPDLDNLVCPKAYESPLGLAKHKARALDYFRTTMKLTSYDYVLHMDEESTMDAESLRGCFDFIRYTTHHMGQGIIIYNGHRYFEGVKGWLFGIADSIRVGDDLARFSLQGNIVHRPIFGIHGSFLMLNGDAENKVGWDFGSLAEDFEFSQAAWKQGFTLGRIHGVVREQSPEGFVDFMKQRRRWYMGIRQIEGIYYLPALAIKLWTAGIFCLAATVLNVLFSLLLTWSGDSPWWIYVCSCFCFGAFIWLYFGGLIFEELDYGYHWTQWWQIPLHLVCLIFIQPCMSLFEASAVIWALSTEDGEVGFQVVKK